jgi:hypothetical protein
MGELERKIRKNMKKLPEKYRKRYEKRDILLRNIRNNMKNLEMHLERANNIHIGEENMVYRFYHESFKVYNVQDRTKSMYLMLEKLSPHGKNKIRDPHYLRIIKEGGFGREFKLEDNRNWDAVCRPMLEAFFHTKYFIEMAFKYGEEFKRKKKAPLVMPYGWASLLELYGIR